MGPPLKRPLWISDPRANADCLTTGAIHQAIHTTANYTFELEPGRLVVEEYTTFCEYKRDTTYVVNLLDPADSDALTPAMSFVALEVSWTKTTGMWRRKQVTYRLRNRLKEAGATLGETNEVQEKVVHATGISDRFSATHADGSECVYDVYARAVGHRYGVRPPAAYPLPPIPGIRVPHPSAITLFCSGPSEQMVDVVVICLKSARVTHLLVVLCRQ